jgi:hypothetical protein
MFPVIFSQMPESRKAPGRLEDLGTMSTLLVLECADMLFCQVPSLLCIKCSGTG